MRKKSVRFRGEASHYLCLPKTTRIALSPLGSNVSVAELQLEGVRPEDLDGKTIVIAVELSRLSGLKTQVLRREDLTEEEWTKICRQEIAGINRRALPGETGVPIALFFPREG